jgi:hypothetical protein
MQKFAEINLRRIKMKSFKNKIVLSIVFALLMQAPAFAQHKQVHQAAAEESTIAAIQVTAWWATQRFRAEMQSTLPYINGFSIAGKGVSATFDYAGIGQEPYTSPVYYMTLENLKANQKIQVFFSPLLTQKLQKNQEMKLDQFLVILRKMSTPQVKIRPAILEDGSIRLDIQRTAGVLPKAQDQLNAAIAADWNNK